MGLEPTEYQVQQSSASQSDFVGTLARTRIGSRVMSGDIVVVHVVV